MIIHVFFTLNDFTMPTVVFGKAVVLFPFFGLTVATLRSSAGLKTAGDAACIATISMPTKAALANAKNVFAPPTGYLDQLYHPALKVAGFYSNLSIEHPALIRSSP
jgi:hypothetical protein